MSVCSACVFCVSVIHTDFLCESSKSPVHTEINSVTLFRNLRAFRLCMAQVQVTILTGCARDDNVQAINPKTAIIGIDVQTTLRETSGFILLCVCYVHQQYTKADPKLLVLILKINVVPKQNHLFKRTTSITIQKAVIFVFTAMVISNLTGYSSFHQNSHISSYKFRVCVVSRNSKFSSSFNLVLWLTAQRTEGMQELSKLHSS